MQHFLSDVSLQKAYDRAVGGAPSATNRSANPKNMLQVLLDVEAALRSNEFVLEVADTTDPGFHSAVVVTNYRILIGIGPKQLKSIDIDLLTGVKLKEEDGYALELRVFGGVYTITGLGVKGVNRIVHALIWVSHYLVEPPESAKVEHNADEIFESWLELQQRFGESSFTPEEMQDQLAEVLADKRWY